MTGYQAILVSLLTILWWALLVFALTRKTWPQRLMVLCPVGFITTVFIYWALTS